MAKNISKAIKTTLLKRYFFDNNHAVFYVEEKQNSGRWKRVGGPYDSYERAEKESANISNKNKSLTRVVAIT